MLFSFQLLLRLQIVILFAEGSNAGAHVELVRVGVNASSLQLFNGANAKLAVFLIGEIGGRRGGEKERTHARVKSLLVNLDGLLGTWSWSLLCLGGSSTNQSNNGILEQAVNLLTRR